MSVLQTGIIWEDKAGNLAQLQGYLAGLEGKTDVVVLPETFSTGFGARAHALAESCSGPTATALSRWAVRYGLAIAGSFLAADGEERFFNRAFFFTPQGETFYMDKRHLFRMGGEAKELEHGTERRIIRFRGWNILLLVCYDLRFPVWSRNVRNEYDLLVYVANWPRSRRGVWDVLLAARAIENQCYVCATNRVGEDGCGTVYDGGSRLLSPKGRLLAAVPDYEAGTATATLSLPELRAFRSKFPVWEDADRFTLEGTAG